MLLIQQVRGEVVCFDLLCPRHALWHGYLVPYTCMATCPLEEWAGSIASRTLQRACLMATQGRRRDDHPEDFDTALSCYEYVQPSLLLVPSDVEVAGLSKSVQSCKLQLLLSLPVWKLCSVKGDRKSVV